MASLGSRPWRRFWAWGLQFLVRIRALSIRSFEDTLTILSNVYPLIVEVVVKAGEDPIRRIQFMQAKGKQGKKGKKGMLWGSGSLSQSMNCWSSFQVDQSYSSKRWTTEQFEAYVSLSWSLTEAQRNPCQQRFQVVFWKDACLRSPDIWL